MVRCNVGWAIDVSYATISTVSIVVAVIVSLVGLGAIYVALSEKMRPTPPATPVPAAEAAA